MTTTVQIDLKRASDYETVFILRADIDSETSEKVIQRAVTAIESANGRLTKVESWGKRRLAYPVGKQRKGFYVYMRYLGYRGTVTELERNLRMLDTVLRHMSVVLAKNIDPTAVTVDPEEVKVRRIEITADDDDREDNIEAQLGLTDDGHAHRPMHHHHHDDDPMAPEEGDIIPGSNKTTTTPPTTTPPTTTPPTGDA